MNPRSKITEFETDWRNFVRGRRLPLKLGVIATLAIAIGANIAVIGNMGVFFGPTVPGATHQRLFEPYLQIRQTHAMPQSEVGMLPRVYVQLADTLKSQAETALYQTSRGSLTIGTSQLNLVYLRTTPSLGNVLGTQTVAGRMFDANDALPGSTPVMLISENLARLRFGSPHAAVGHWVVLDGKSFRVVGVLPGTLQFPSRNLTRGVAAEAWTPLELQTQGELNQFAYTYHALVYAPSSMSRDALQSVFLNAYQAALSQYSAKIRFYTRELGIRPQVATLTDREYGDILNRLYLLELVALVLLVLVFVNLSGLAATDALAQRHVLAMRAALGATTFRMYVERARELLTLGVVGWLIGIGVGWLGSKVLADTVGRAGESAVFFVPVLLLSLLAVLLITFLLSFVGLRRLIVAETLSKDLTSGNRSTYGRHVLRISRTLAVVQLAACVVLLALTTHLQIDVFGLMHNSLGFNPKQRIFFSVALFGGKPAQSSAQYLPRAKQAFAFNQDFLASMRTLPGVEQAAALTVAPLTRIGLSSNVSLTPGAYAPGPMINRQMVSDDVIRALGLHVLAGDPNHVFTDTREGVFLDQTAVQRLWPGIPATKVIGQTIYDGGYVPKKVYAVVASLRMRPYGTVGGTMFFPLAQWNETTGVAQGFVIQSTLAPQILRAELSTALRKIDPQTNLIQFRSGNELIYQAYADRIRLTQLFFVVAIVTLLIAGVGLFALLTYRAFLWQPELAIRCVLGATPVRLFTAVLGETAILWIFGCIIGLPLAFVLCRFMALQLPEFGSLAPNLAIAVATALGIAALIVAVVPALRTAQVDLTHNINV